jgi:hypothetical protein
MGVGKKRATEILRLFLRASWRCVPEGAEDNTG